MGRCAATGPVGMAYVGPMEPNQPSGPDPYRPNSPAGAWDRPGAGPGSDDRPPLQYGPAGPEYGRAPGQQYGSGQQYGTQGQQYGSGHRFGTQPGQPRARTGLVLVLALVVEILLIAAFANQWLSEKIARFEFRTHNSLLASIANAGLTYTWRFAPRTGDNQHLWLSQMLLILTVLVLSALLIASIIRGPITFGRAFFGTWMSVVVATELATIVRGLVVGKAFDRPGTGRFTYAVFGSLGPNAPSFVAALGLGLITALVVGIVAPATRRVPATGRDSGGPTAYPEHGGGGLGEGWQDQHFGPPAGHALPPTGPPRNEPQPDATSQLPRLPDTGQRPAQREPEQQPGQSSGAGVEPGAGRDEATTQPPRSSDEQPTTAFPRPPDDERLDPEHD
jgi:hypothetical protein